ncbi:hypothetical protein [Seonamhaeicola aphaedonensis]|uniref:Tetratricopeptide repeat protein n=1 Tax=Seonamhaeicola aphaedonensis TaxID=1461338 RepID=A0A3D9HN86_9FLAO|nr:hypothetical protein [Seonamhaeicola aphaedonensis]RED50356.1 hypothetical protein DFQ02_101385 [Seonamhaeicola aphaedonensis]
MNSSDFTNILQHPQEITHQQTEAIKSVIDEFPYFQSARAVYLKGLKNQSSFKYNQELKTTAAYTTDRSILFDFITSESFVQNEISQFIKQNTEHLNDIDVSIEDLSVNKSVAIDEALKLQIKETKGVLDPALFQPKEPLTKKEPHFTLDESEAIETAAESTLEPELSATEILSLGKPLQFDKNEKHSFNEWLKLTRYKPIKRDTIPKNKPEEKEELLSTELEKTKKFELIDKFISKNPKIKPAVSSSKKGNLAKAQMIKPEALMTETLARIYVEQRNYKKAIQSYKILSLKYPEKSGFFANQIKAVEQLQEQNNKE